MGDHSAIQWTDATWNPVRGCTKISAGCKHCYAETFAERFRGVKGHPYEQGFDLRLVPEALDLPLRCKKPRRVFVNSMSDLFHEDVPEAFIGAIFTVMASSPQHTFQALTKRADRMRDVVSRIRWHVGLALPSWAPGHLLTHLASLTPEDWKPIAAAGHPEQPPLAPPLTVPPNVWLGVSCEDQATANERIPHLLATPAAVRFVSAEPLLGPVDLRRWLPEHPGGRCSHEHCTPREIDWVIIGGESGPKARPCDVAWMRSLLAQCRAAAVPAFVKQLGAKWAQAAGNPGYYDAKGGEPERWPADLRVRQMPEVEP